MTPASLKAWRMQHNWAQAAASRELGISENGYMSYERGWSRRKVGGKIENVNIRIPKTIALACAAISHGLKPIE